jgi:cephalosporin hydroxylase
MTPSPSDLYHSWYYDSELWRKTSFLGVSCLKSVSDMWNYQEILAEIKPSLVLEMGTYYGGSTLYFAEILQLISPRSRILSVDIDLSVVDERVRRHHRVELLESDTTNPMVATRFSELRREYGGKAFCIVDSYHTKEHVLAELMLLRSVTERGDYVVVEDGNINGHPVRPDWGPGPYEALEEYLAQYPDDYTPDLEREKKFGFTFAPKGFLIRR